MIYLYSYLKEYKPKHFNSASINYVYEVSAIPIAIREEYLQKLLKRKNADNQKNVRLIKLIYKYISNDNIESWDPEEICKKLDISYHMLRYHKSRFLKQLREYYFKWKDFSREIENSSEKTDAFTKNFLIAKKMYEIGMRKESKTIMLRLLHEVGKRKKTKEITLCLSELYELLMDYYFRQRNLPKFNILLNGLKGLINPALESEKTDYNRKEKALLNTRLYLGLGIKKNFKVINDNSLNLILNLCIKALKEAKISGSNYHIVYLLHECGHLEKLLGNYDNAISYFKKGLEEARKYKLIAYYYSIRSSLAYEKFRKNKVKYLIYFKEIERCYNIIKKTALHSYTFRSVSNNYYNMLIYTDNEKIPQLQLEIVNCLFLYPSTPKALWELYNYKFGTAELFKWKFKQNSDTTSLIPEIDNLIQENCIKMENRITQIISQFHKINQVNQKLMILEDYLYIEFLKGPKCNFAKTDMLISKIDWILRTRHFTFEQSAFHLLKVCLKMLDDFKDISKTEFLTKYQKSFEDMTLKIFSSSDVSFLSYYSIACYTAQQIGYKEITEISDNLYRLIEKNHPEILAPILRELEASKHEVYTIVGGEQSAA